MVFRRIYAKKSPPVHLHAFNIWCEAVFFLFVWGELSGWAFVPALDKEQAPVAFARALRPPPGREDRCKESQRGDRLHRGGHVHAKWGKIPCSGREALKDPPENFGTQVQFLNYLLGWYG